MSLEWQNANGERSSSCPLSAVLEGQTQKAHHYAWLVSQALWALTHSSRVYRWNRQAYIQFRVLASRGRQPSVRVWQAGTYLVSESSFADGMQTRGDTLKAIRKQLSLSSLLLSDTMVNLSRNCSGYTYNNHGRCGVCSSVCTPVPVPDEADNASSAWMDTVPTLSPSVMDIP